MGQIVAEFFNVIGPSITPPTNMVELIPYLVTVFIGIFVVALTFKLFIAIASAIVNGWRKF